MNRSITYTYRGANQDITKSKHSNEYYFDASHIRIITTTDQSSGSVSNEKGTELIIEIPEITINKLTSTIIYGEGQLNFTSSEINALPNSSVNQIIIGHVTTRTGVVLFTTDDNGIDCVWEIEDIVGGIYTLTLKYINNLNFSSSYPIQAIYNFENENIEKVYWVDGINQIRNLNLRYESIEGNSNLVDLPATTIYFVGEVDFSQPVISDIVTGGNHTAGKI
jgi:hypothetical protein